MSTTEWQRLLIVIGIIVILNIWIGYEISTFPIHNPTNNIFQRNNTKESHQSTKNLIKQNSHCLNHIYDAIFVISIPIRHETLSITSAQLISENINFILWKGHSADNPHSVELWNIYRNNWKHVPDHWGNSVYKQLNIFLLRQTDIDIIHYSLKKNFSKILILEDDILLADTYWFQLFCKIEPNLPEWYILNLGINNILYDGDNLYNNQSNFFQHKNVSNFENSKMKYYQTPGRAYGTFAISFSYKIYEIILDVYDMDSKPGMRSDFPLDSYPEILPISPYNMGTHINDKFLSINPTLFLPDVTTSILRDGETSMNEYIKTHTSDNDNSRFKQYWKLRFSDKSLVFSDKSPSQIYLQNNRLAHYSLKSNCISNSTVNVFPNYKIEQAFWAANDLLNHSTNNTYSLAGGILLQMYRDCGLRIDSDDIDFNAPLQYLYAVKIAFLNSANFTLDYIFGKENQTGYELSFRHVTGIKVDVGSVNNANGMVFEPLWVDNILHCCIMSNHTTYGHILRVGNYTFSVIGPIDAIEQYLENLYGPNWAIPIPTTKWNWQNERCIPYIDNGGRQR